MADTTGSARGGTEERILGTAASLFSQFGYNGVSTREIAASAEVNEVTIYRHFPRKRDLYLAVLCAAISSLALPKPRTAVRRCSAHSTSFARLCCNSRSCSACLVSASLNWET